MPTLIWFRRDLRVADNSALYHAARTAKDGVVGLFVVTPDQWKQHHDADCKIHFWMECVRELSVSLGKLNIPLIIKTCASLDESVIQVVSVAKKQKCQLGFFNREYEVNEMNRDKAVAAECMKAKIGSAFS